MIIEINSYFRKPPKVLAPKQVIIFNAICYSLDICDMAYSRLKKNLYDFAFHNQVKPNFPVLFSDTWTIIQSLATFIKIVSNQFEIDFNDPLFDEIRYTKYLRDTNQHIDERITEILSREDLPVYGILSWYAQKQIDSSGGIITTLYSGTITNKKSLKVDVVNPSGKENSDTINDIEFTAISKPKRKKEEYIQQKVNINDLIKSTNNIIDHLEKQIRDQLQNVNSSERHTTDLVFQMHVKKGNTK